MTTRPFSLRVRAPRGPWLLDTLSEVGTSPYGGLSATLDLPRFPTQVIPGWDDYRPGEGPWLRADEATVLVHTSDRLVLELRGDGLTTELELLVAGPRLRLRSRSTKPQGEGLALNKASLSFRLPDDEHFFGLGERFATLDHRGWSLYSWAEEGSLGGGEGVGPTADNPFPNGPSMTYFPVPFFLSTRGYGVHLDTTVRTEVHLGSERADAWRVAANAAELALTVYVNADPKRTLDQFTEDTGRPIVPAPWVFGPRRRISPNSLVDGEPEWKLMRRHKLPLTGIDDALHFLPASQHLGREDELRAWTKTLHAHGFKVMAYNNPYVAQDHPRAASDYAYGKERGLFVKGPDGEPVAPFLVSGEPLHVAMVDFTNPEAVTWYKSLLRRALALGYDGWMHDFGEYVPRRSSFFDGRKGDELHNLYPVLSAKAARELLQEEKPDDHLFFVRAGYTGSQAYVPAVWGGDAEASFDETQGLPSALRSGLSLALSGVPYWGSDGTGFKCVGKGPHDKEMYVRWLELEAVSPIMMDQRTCKSLSGPKKKWTLWDDQQTQDVYRQMAGLHTQLQPYFLVLAQEAARSGLPLMRHPVLTHPSSPEASAVTESFFLGPALYASPVVQRGQREKEVWFPPGARYLDYFEHRVHEGGSRAVVAAPLDRLVLFLVEGELLPMLHPAVETLVSAEEPSVVTAASRADWLEVKAFLGQASGARLALADGTELAIERAEAPAGREGWTSVSFADTERCTRCFAAERSGEVRRLVLVTEPSATLDATFEGLRLRVAAPVARRLRWEILDDATP